MSHLGNPYITNYVHENLIIDKKKYHQACKGI